MRKLFGIGVQSFAPGIDGGRDALFIGVAESYPSAAAPWCGATVGQAKHTIATNAHFSDADFGGEADSSVLSCEAIRVKKLVDAREVDNYILFANRRLGGVTEPRLRRRFAESVGLPADRVHFHGVEFLDDLMHQFPDIVLLADINPLEGPLVVSSHELAEVILAISEQLNDLPVAVDAPVTARISYDDKNAYNRMSPEFAAELSRKYLKDTSAIERFLANPSNTESLRRYESAVDEFQLKVIEKRSDFASFDSVFNHLFEVLVGQNGILSRNRRLLRVMLFYMYWHCDIGLKPHVATQ